MGIFDDTQFRKGERVRLIKNFLRVTQTAHKGEVFGEIIEVELDPNFDRYFVAWDVYPACWVKSEDILKRLNDG